MKRLISSFALVCSMSLPILLDAQIELQSSFPLTDGTVKAINGRNDTLFIGGSFHYIGPKTEGLGFITATGDSLLKDFPQVSSSSTSWVNTIISDQQGGWYIGGYFTHVNGLPRLNAAHIHANGQVGVWNPSPEGEVKSMAVKNGRVYLGGNFQTIQGQARSKIAMVDRQYGSLQPFAITLNDPPLEMLLLGNHLYLSGWFSQVGGASQNFLVRADTATGSVDMQWNPTPNAYVYALATDSQSIFAGGDFTSIGGMGRQRLARLDLVNGQALPFSHNVDGQVKDLHFRSGILFLVGGFWQIDNQSRKCIASISLNTDSLTTLAPNISQYNSPYFSVNQMTLAGDTMFFSGVFSSVDGQGRNGAAAFDLQFNQLLPWNPNASGPAFHSSVFTICKSGHQIALGGNFLILKAQARYGLAAVHRKTGKVMDWNPGGAYQITTLELDHHKLWVGGYFSSFGGQARQNLAIIDLNSGLLDPTNLAADGPVKVLHRNGGVMYIGGDFQQLGGQSRGRAAALHLNTGQLLPWNPKANNSIHSIAAFDSVVYLGGYFSELDGISKSRLARVDSAIGQTDGWGYTLDGPVYALLVDQQHLYVGGGFNSVNGITRKGIFKLDLLTGLQLPWAPSMSIYGHDFSAHALQKMNGYLLAGGWGFLADRWNLLAIDTSTAGSYAWSPYPCGWNNEWNEGSVEAIFAQDKWLAVGGSFERMSGQNRPSLALYRLVSPPIVQLTHAVHHLDSTAEIFIQVVDNGGSELLQWALETALDSLGLSGWTTLITQQTALPSSIVLSSLQPEATFYLRLSATNSAGTTHSLPLRMDVPKAPIPLVPPDQGDLMGFAIEAEIGFAMASAPQQAGTYAEAFDTLALNGPFAHMGAVYVYKQWPGQWIEWQRLLAPDRDSSDQFGYALAKNGDVLAVGAPFEGAQNNGAVYLFHRNNWDQWVFTQKITSADNASDAHFGSALDWWGNTLAVGSPGNASVHIFTYSWNNLQHQQTLLDASANSGFGHALKLYRDSLIIGAPEADGGGAASLWMLNGSGIFQETASIVNLDAFGSLRFGYAVDIGRGNLFVSDPEIERVYVFRYNGSQWNRTQTLQQTPAVMGHHFGSALSWNGDQLLVGAPGTDSAQGMILPYHSMNGQWVAQNPIPAPDGQKGDLFGWSISQGAAVWIGAPQRSFADHRPSASNSGGVYALNLPLNRGILAPTWNHGNSLDRAFDPQWNPLLIEEDAVAHCTPYPNPTTGLLHIPLKDIHALELVDLYGRILWQSTVNGFDSEYSLDLSPWPAGIYLLRSHKTDGDWISALLFKQ